MITLNAIGDFFDWITEFFTSIVNIIEHIFSTIVYFYRLLSVSTTYIHYTLLTLPSWVQIFGTVCVSVSILYLLVGRETGCK